MEEAAAEVTKEEEATGEDMEEGDTEEVEDMEEEGDTGVVEDMEDTEEAVVMVVEVVVIGEAEVEEVVVTEEEVEDTEAAAGTEEDTNVKNQSPRLLSFIL